MSNSQPVRTAIIGLSTSAVTSWASEAHLPAFQAGAGQSRLHIVALCNSSVEAARAVIKTYNLSSDTKAYGSPQDLADNPDVDFVICNTRVDKHYETILPSIKAGKDVYIEWPIASNKTDIDALIEAAKKSGSKALAGLQGRSTAPVVKLKEIIASGAIGDVLSVEVKSYGVTLDRDFLPAGLQYFAQMIDFVQSVVGDIIPGTDQTRLQIQRPQVAIRDPATMHVVETVQSDVPELLFLHGSLPSTAPGGTASLSFNFRRGQPFPGTPALTWSINGTLGEVRLVSPAAMALQAEEYTDPVTIQVHNFATDTVEDVSWEWESFQQEIAPRGRSVQKVLYAYADWKIGRTSDPSGLWVGIEDAAKRAAQIERWLDGWAKNQQSP